jgi:tetratricopeptide (TPR) repeat protein
MKKYSFFLVIFFSIFSLAQKTSFDLYEIELQKADSLFSIKEYKKAIMHYKESIKYKPNNSNSPYKKIAEIYTLKRNYKKAMKYIALGVSNVGSTLDFFEYHKPLKDNLPTQYWNKLKSEEKKYLDYFFENVVDYQAYVKMQLLLAKDQAFRSVDLLKQEMTEEQQENFKKLYPNHNLDMSALTGAFQIQDYQNILDLIEIAKQYGYQKGMYLLLWHQRGNYGEKNFIWDFFKPFFQKEIEEGNINKSFWCPFDDFLSYTKTGKQIYGEFEMGTVDKNTVNEMRKKVNLPPLSDKEIEAINNRANIMYN